MQMQKDFNDFLRTELNEPQRQAATKKDEALLVIAGAGSGKTRVITSRIAHLIINENVAPASISALTFTNKAADEMKSRLINFLGAQETLPFVGTFHSYCLRILRSNPALLPFPNFSIMDADDQVSLLKKIIKNNALEKHVKAAQVSYQISNIKNKRNADTSQEPIEPLIKEIYMAYETEKAASHSFDFDDLILQVLKLFEKKSFKESFQKHVRHVLVDEYQDTSEVQHQFLQEMALGKKNKFMLDSLCAVGDEDQSIYSWRGATVANMLKFQNDFKPVKVVKIEQNYRSVKPILDAANSVIENNKLRNPKKLWSERQAKNRLALVSCRSGEQEAEVIAHTLKQLPRDKKLHNVAILYRTHFQSRSIEEALIHHGIAYRIVGGIRFYERKEVKDMLAYLRLFVNPFDKISLLRVINTPTRGLGQKFEEELLTEWMKNPFFDFKQLLDHMCTSPEIALTPIKKTSVQAFLNMYRAIDENATPSVIIAEIIKKTDYLNHLRTTFDPKDSEAKIENVQELVQSITMYEQNFVPKKRDDIAPDDPFFNETSQPALQDFLHEVSLMQEKTDQGNKEDQVQMMTLHAAKGLEFDMVIIAGLEEGLLPSARSLHSTESLEEERRLFYVGVTRAKEHLLMFNASYRNSYGQISDQVVSRFAAEIKPSLVSAIDLEDMHSIEQKTAVPSWLGLKAASDSLMTFSSFRSKTFIKKSTSVSNKKKPPVRASVTNKKPTSKFGNKSSFKAQSIGPWQKNEQVSHPTFGFGIITKVDKAQGNDYYITAIFKAGQKKVLSSFLKKA